MKKYHTTNQIARIETTNDTLTGRAGIAPFARYLEKIKIYPILEQLFSKIRKSAKGLPLWKLFLQVFCFLFDGTSRHLTYFDELAKDKGYAATIGLAPKDMASSHTVKRFFKAFGWLFGGVFREVLNKLYEWRLQLNIPTEIELTIDTMVMDNDDAEKRHGVQPTYKKVKGFQPLQMIWNGKIVDAVFRGGKKHSNYGNTVINMIRRMVSLIRRVCGENVLIVIRLDAGFFDEKIVNACNELGVGFILSGKMLESVKERVLAQPAESWHEYDNGRQTWMYTEFGWKCDKWDRSYRTFYTQVSHDENGQGLLSFARPDNVILTNLGIESKVLEHCTAERMKHWLDPRTIIESHHLRGADELPHRGLKDFGFEQLPFKRFTANQAFYYCMLIGFFLFETYKEDVLCDVIPLSSYATTVRRRAVDFAGKIVRTGGQIILKVTCAVMERLRFDRIWEACQSPQAIPQLL